MSLISIKDLLPQSLSRNRIKPQIEAVNVLAKFRSIVREVWGDEVCEFVEPKYVKERVLYIHCNSSSAANALSLAKKKIIEEINKLSEESLVDDIVFWQ